ncbi:MAG TPA: 5-formyltetrahydrofolate cyclo-ligase [Holophagaceae bacterium]|nr:5-formyltetrahydrofolate cyclo-ligase [Holophagaceae bacterium]
MEPFETKAELRTRFGARRDGLGAAARAEASARVCAHLGKLFKDRRIRSVATFWPIRSEVDLRPLLAAHPDLTFLFPRLASQKPPRLIWGPEPLERGTFGLMEPAFAQHLTPPVDVVLVPGLAFDAQGYRLGYGGGYYDALLAHLNEDVLTVAVGFEAQRTEAVPVGPLDMPVDGLVTEAGITWFEG